MKKLLQKSWLILFTLEFLTKSSCKEKSKVPSTETIDAINLKKGELVLCSLRDKKFGGIEFKRSCSEKSKTDFTLAVALLHSYEYEEAEKVLSHQANQIHR